MVPTFVIHDPDCHERDDIVKDIQDKTGADKVLARVYPDGKRGCRESHLLCAEMASNIGPDQSYFVFEDDCVLSEDWVECLPEEAYDIYYLGYNKIDGDVIYGTHAMLIGWRARTIFLRHAEEEVMNVSDIGAWDHIVSRLVKKYNLHVWFPKENRYAIQKPGLISSITGKRRKPTQD